MSKDNDHIIYHEFIIKIYFDDGDWIAEISLPGDNEPYMPSFGLTRDLAITHAKNKIDKILKLNKLAYFQGGGGENEPTPGKKKYKSDKAIIVQPRFEEPLYRNYDVYDTEGVNGPAKHGPGSGWHHMHEFKSIKEFLEHRRKKLKDKYKADDSWIEDTESNYKKRVEKMKVRTSLINRIVKIASNSCKDIDIEFTDRRDAFICGRCFHMGPNSGGKAPSAKELHAGKNHNADGIDWRNDDDKSDPKYLEWKKRVDSNDSSNFDYGDGAYTAMSEGKKMDTITNAPHKSPGAFFTDAQYMLPPKEHGTSIYDSKNSPYQGTPKIPKQLKINQDNIKADDNAIDFDIDDQIKSSPIIGETGSYPASAQIGGYLDKYLPQDDFEGKSPDKLDFGRDYTSDLEPSSDIDYGNLEELMNKYLSPKETDIYGLPDGILPPEDKDADATINHINPEAGETDSGNTLYEDKWNI